MWNEGKLRLVGPLPRKKKWKSASLRRILIAINNGENPASDTLLKYLLLFLVSKIYFNNIIV